MSRNQSAAHEPNVTVAVAAQQHGHQAGAAGIGARMSAAPQITSPTLSTMAHVPLWFDVDVAPLLVEQLVGDAPRYQVIPVTLTPRESMMLIRRAEHRSTV